MAPVWRQSVRFSVDSPPSGDGSEDGRTAPPCWPSRGRCRRGRDRGCRTARTSSGRPFLVLAEVGIVGQDVADPAEPDPGDAPDVRAGVMWNSARSVAYRCSDTSSSSRTWPARSGSSGVPSSSAEHGDVEGGVAAPGPGRAPALGERVDQPGERPLDRRLAALAHRRPAASARARHWRSRRGRGRRAGSRRRYSRARPCPAPRRRAARAPPPRSGTSHSRRARTRSRRSRDRWRPRPERRRAPRRCRRNDCG